MVGSTFLLRVPLPKKFNGKYDPVIRTQGTLTLLKPGDRPRFTKPRKTKPTAEPKPKQAAQNASTEKVSNSQVKRTSEDRREYEKRRQQDPKRKEAQRRSIQERCQRRKANGLCRDCAEPATAGQTRCEECAKKHRDRRRKSDKDRRGREKAARESNARQ